MKVYIGSSSTYEIYTKLALLLQDVNSTAVVICYIQISFSRHLREAQYIIVLGKCPWALSSSTKMKVCAWLHRGVLNGSTTSTQGPTPDAKLAARGTESTCIIASSKASLTVEKAVSCYRADQFIALLPKFPQCSEIFTELCRGKQCLLNIYYTYEHMLQSHKKSFLNENKCM